MIFRALTSENLTPIRNAVPATKDIRGNADGLVTKLIEFTANPNISDRIGLKVTQATHGQYLADLETPFGDGRLRLTFAVTGADFQEGIEGRLLVEVPETPSRERWQAVWGLNVPRFGHIWYGASDAKVVLNNNDAMFNSSSYWAVLAEVASSIVYAVANGPQID